MEEGKKEVKLFPYYKTVKYSNVLFSILALIHFVYFGTIVILISMNFDHNVVMQMVMLIILSLLNMPISITIFYHICYDKMDNFLAMTLCFIQSVMSLFCGVSVLFFAPAIANSSLLIQLAFNMFWVMAVVLLIGPMFIMPIAVCFGCRYSM